MQGETINLILLSRVMYDPRRFVGIYDPQNECSNSPLLTHCHTLYIFPCFTTSIHLILFVSSSITTLNMLPAIRTHPWVIFEVSTKMDNGPTLPYLAN